MKGIVGQTSVVVGRLAPSRPRRTTSAAATSSPALKTWSAVRRRPGAAVSYAQDRAR